MREDLNLHASLCHKWIKEAMPNGMFELIHVLSDDPCQTASALRSKWGATWQADNRLLADAANKKIAVLRAQMLPVCPEALSRYKELFAPESLRKGAQRYSKKTSIGGDSIEFQWIANMPDAVLQGLSDLYLHWVTTLALPSNLLQHLMAAIPKKDPGTHRLIAVIATLLRLFMGLVCRHEVRPWDEAVALPGDSAAPGQACEFATLQRHLALEMAFLTGEHASVILWDLQAFYDTINIEVLADQALAKGFPKYILVLCLQLHMAPRLIQSKDMVSEPVEPATGAVAGDSSSTSLARALLHDAVGSEACPVEEVTISANQHVDDITQSVIGSCIQNMAH